ncbi:MAG: MATE family efflux transporter, partial [Nocardioidaceae bacterium]
PGIRRAAHAGTALVVRTLTLRASLLLTTYAAATLGATSVATHQLALTIWTFLAFALDAVAIAAQALTGRTLGAGDVEATRAVTDRILRWGLLSGVVTGLALALAAPFLAPLFSSDPAVAATLWPVLLVAAAFQPVAGVVFVLAGGLIGAGDGRYLAAGGALVLAGFVPLVWLTVAVVPAGSATGSLVALWLAFGTGFMGGRAAVLLHRVRGTAWQVTGG